MNNFIPKIIYKNITTNDCPIGHLDSNMLKFKLFYPLIFYLTSWTCYCQSLYVQFFIIILWLVVSILLEKLKLNLFRMLDSKMVVIKLWFQKSGKDHSLGRDWKIYK